MDTLPPETLLWIREAIGKGAVVRDARQMAGATSSRLCRLDIEYHDRLLPFVLRRYDNADWLAAEPDVPRREEAGLHKAWAAGLAAPQPIACDATGEQSGGLPATLMTCLPGTVLLTPQDIRPWLRGLAAPLPALHALDADDFPWRYAPYNNPLELTPPAWSGVPALWERAIALAAEPPPSTGMCFIHRDYHPNNVLWQDGTVSGVVDWPNACCGPAGADIAWCRLNLAFMLGVPAADGFLREYQDRAGAAYTHFPYWDLLTLMEVLPGPPRFYSPWAAFGLPVCTSTVLRERVDTYLASILKRI